MSTLKLSEAIRLGAMLKPQAFDALVSGEGGKGGSCAIGAAIEAFGIEMDEFACDLLAARVSFPVVGCPCCLAAGFGKKLDVIMHLNDVHRLTREQIADWVATIEPQTETAEPEVSLPSVAQETR